MNFGDKPSIVGVVEMMGVADIQELSIEAPVTPLWYVT